ncbi:hypothetical protein JCM10296v2_004721 [Rhodotorula toruloides]
MTTNPATPTDEPSSHLSNRLSRSPDEDAGKATSGQNGSRGLVATAPRSLSSLPTEVLQNIFTQLHQSLKEIAFSDHWKTAQIVAIHPSRQADLQHRAALLDEPIHPLGRPYQSNCPTLLRLSGLDYMRFASWDSLRLDRDLPLVRHLAVDDESLIDVLAPGFRRLTRLTIGHFAMGRNHIPWHSVSRLELNPGDEMEAFEPAQFIESLTAYMCEPANPPLPLEELVFAFPTLRQATEVNSQEDEFCQANPCHIFQSLRPSALRSLSLCRIESFKWTQPVFLLPSVTLLSLDGYGDLTPVASSERFFSACIGKLTHLDAQEGFNHFLGFLELFPALQELRLSGFDILRETAADPTPTVCDAETLARLSSRKLACLGPSLVILLFTLQCTKVTKVAYRESLTVSDEMRWQREPGGAFKGERWTLC